MRHRGPPAASRGEAETDVAQQYPKDDTSCNERFKYFILYFVAARLPMGGRGAGEPLANANFVGVGRCQHASIPLAQKQPRCADCGSDDK